MIFGKKKKDTKNNKRTFLGRGGQVSPENQMEGMDARYRAMLSKQERIERIELVATKLKQRYEKYSEIETFVEYLRATDEIFARAENEHWSIEETREEMIKGEIYLMALDSGIDERVFLEIYEEFSSLNSSARRIQIIAKKLTEKYNDNCNPACIDFITYIRDYLLIFSEAINKNLSLTEAKDQIVRARMKVIASHEESSIHVLESIYKEFIDLLHDENLDLSML